MLPRVAPSSPHQVNRPQCEKILASKVSDSKVPSFAYSGPRVKTFPGLAVATKTFPPGPARRLVTCSDSDLATLEYTSLPSSSMIAPLFPVPNNNFPEGAKPVAKTKSSREVHSVSGEPSGDSFTTSAPPVADAK